jgi:hypothetical protein
MFRKRLRARRQRVESEGLSFLVLTLCLSLVFASSVHVAGEELDKLAVADKLQSSDGAVEEIWDSAKYISIDEIQPGMEAYFLTCYRGTEIEKFDLDVLSIVRNIKPGSDAILVQGTDERLIETGPVLGCSGSPVYIDGRLAGAVAYVPGGLFSKDPLYAVTPIEEMLRVGQGTLKREREGLGNKVSSSERSVDQSGFVFDFSKPIDFAEIGEQITTPRRSRSDRAAGGIILPCPLITSSLPAEVCEQLDALVKPFGLMAVSGIGGRAERSANAQDVQLVPGACLAVPLVTGDIEMEVLGTVTEVVGDKVYGFGHSFLGYGPIDLPMATGHVHTVVSNLSISSKLASAFAVVGALRTDESAAVCGQIGAKARMILVTIRVDRYNDTEPRVYNCQVAYNQLLTPGLLRAAVSGAALYLGDFPPDHMIEYDVAIGIDDARSIRFENVSTELGLAEMIAETTGSVALLMNNPYGEVDIRSIDFDVRIVPQNIVSHIWSVNLSDSKAKAGQEINVGVIVESFLAGKKKYEFTVRIPDELAPGRYDLTVCGSYEYERFLRKAVPYRFVAQDLSSLLEALNNALRVPRAKLYCLLALPASGVTVERAELPDLPATKALVLQDGKRTVRIQPYPHWLEKSLDTGTVVVDKKVIRVTVER